VSEDGDDTVLVPPRAPAQPIAPDTDDTVIPIPKPRPTEPARIERPAEPPVTTATGPVHATYYRFRVGERADSIPLDVPSYIGRQPSSPRVISGVAPRLVRVPSPNREVSATHLEVRQLGSSVIVTDLRSTNGSTVMLPGSVPRKLRQGESVVVSPGTLVDIGDDNILQILPMQRPA
jgi:pSer/pThr/pTyr-binding forkhead associated (FHA) protein